MPKTVFILGAGASVHAGAPVMKDFLDRSEMLLSTGEVENQRQDFEAVFNGIHRLQAVFAKSFIDLRNLEAVFVAFEMARLLGRLPGDPKSVDRLPDALRQVIVTTLEKTIQYPIQTDFTIGGTIGYANLADFLKAHLSDPIDQRPSVITFNYDCALDYAMCVAEVPVDYCASGAVSENSIQLLKLHGSLNWIGPEQSGDLNIWQIEAQPAPILRHGQLEAPISFSRMAASHFGSDPNSIALPVIVPPTASKASHHLRLKNVWRQAANELSRAEVLIIAGYSLPATDEFFRYLYSLGTEGRTRLKAIWVFDPGANDLLDQRFRGLFGPLAAERYSMSLQSFESVAQRLKNEPSALPQP